MELTLPRLKARIVDFTLCVPIQGSPMHLISLDRPASGLFFLLAGKFAARGSQAAALAGGTPPHAPALRLAAWQKALLRPIRDVATALDAIAWARDLPGLEKSLATEEW